MSEATLRYLAMLRCVPRRPGKISASAMRERLVEQGFEVTLRTVQRDLHHLSGMFPLISDEPAKPTGWSWSGAVEDLPAMEPHTALAFVLAQRFLEPLLPPATLAALAPHIARAEAVLDNLGRSGLGAWPGKVRVVPRGQRLLPAPIDPRVLEVVYAALLGGRCFDARYRPRGAAGAVDYEVNPLGLVFRDAVVYLVCTLWDYQDVKQLALHRFDGARVLDQWVQVPRGFDLDDYLASGAFAYPVTADRPVRLVALFDADAAKHLRETPLAADQRLRDEPDKRVRLRATVADTSELRWWLLGFGDQVEVVKPVAMRREFARIAGAMAKRYRRAD